MPEAPGIQIQPLQITIHSGTIMMVTDREGWIRGNRAGLFAHDTRYLSTYTLTFDQYNPRFLTAEKTAHNSVVLTYTNDAFRVGSVAVEEFSLFLKITRILDEGLHERIEITSFERHPISFPLMVNLECSFETIFEVRGLQHTPPRLTHQWYDGESRTMVCSYRNEWFSRQLSYQVVSTDGAPRYSPSLLIVPIRLSHDQTWQMETTTCLGGEPLGRFSRSIVDGPTGQSVDEVGRNPPTAGIAERLRKARADRECWTERLTSIQTANRVVQRAYDQALRDLASLRLQRVGDEWYPAAGVPWYNCVFGRDALIAAIQSLPLGCPFPRAVLTRLAELQGTRVNLWNDEEPGKIAHELRVGELSLMGKIPFDPFYGTVDASLYYVILLSETYRYSGDGALLEQFVGAVDGCLRWAAEYGDVDGDGFVEYWMRSPSDFHNQAWKDARDAVVYPDGAVVPDPIAIVEVQGLYYNALRRASEIYQILGRCADADAAERRAEQLAEDFNRQYWMPDEGFYVFGLDPWKRPIRSIASNPGQLLWTGIVPPDRATCVARRLMADDMFCGWGVRTLSSHNGAYDPVTYQRGSVWPFDNAIIAQGLKKYGHWQETNRIAEGIFAASGYFANGHLPELWAGLNRDETECPVLYPRANIPQAWSAGSVPMLLQAILGLEPDVSHRQLLVDPTLPDWLDDVTLRGLRFAGGSVDLRFTGIGTDTRVEVLRTTGGIDVERRPPGAGGSTMRAT